MSSTETTESSKPYRAGDYTDPQKDDPYFDNLLEAEEYAERYSKAQRSAYALWDGHDNTVFLFYNYQAFVPKQ